jgi:hypothetical protein
MKTTARHARPVHTAIPTPTAMVTLTGMIPTIMTTISPRGCGA